MFYQGTTMTRTASDAKDNASHHDAQVFPVMRIAAVAAILFDHTAALALLDLQDAELGRLFQIHLIKVAGLSMALNLDLGSICNQNQEEAGQTKRGSIRRISARRSLVAEGKLLRASGFCAASGVTERKLGKDIASGDMFSVDIQANAYYPAFFLIDELNRKELAKVARRLDDLAGWDKCDFFTSPNAALGNLTPLQALVCGEVRQVLRTAVALIQK